MTRSPAAAARVLAEHAREGAAVRIRGAHGAVGARVLADASGVVRLVIVVADDAAALRVATDLAFVRGERAPTADSTDGPIVVMPALDTSPFGDLSPDIRTVAGRFAVLGRWVSDDPPAVTVVPLAAAMRRTWPRAAFDERSARWRRGAEIDHSQAIATLIAAGYQRADVVEDPGSFAVRGGVIDAYLASGSQPVRIEWFGDEIERIRGFDPQSQRSERDLEHCDVIPVSDAVVTAPVGLRQRVLGLADQLAAPTTKVKAILETLETGRSFFGIDALASVLHAGLDPIWAYLPAGARLVVDEPTAILGAAAEIDAALIAEHGRAVGDRRLVAAPEALAIDATDIGDLVAEAWAVIERLSDDAETTTRALVEVSTASEDRLLAEIGAARGRKRGELLAPVLARIAGLPQAQRHSVVVASPNLVHAERMVALFVDHGVMIDPPRPVADVPALLTTPGDGGPPRIAVVAGELSEGWSSEDDRTLVLSEADIFGPIAHRSKPKRRKTGVAGLGQLAIGDYVVHVTHGVGRYAGLAQLALGGGVAADYVLVEYAGSDRLYLPVVRLGEIERYVSAEAKPPKLDKMGGQSFATKAAKVKAEVKQIAEELLQVYAQREALGGHAHPDGGEVYREFEATFPFEETPDQLDAITATMRDLGREQPMDRLVCGDVGFGKTEVALRAACRVALGGKQVAILAPTTVLVQQHYHTFKERMAPFGIEVGVLSRFTEAADRSATLAGIKGGGIDVVVGTHRLLSTDVRFRDLGLVVIDEEQRFGVGQKERFKKLKTQVDVLTLTATPIPRTLHMSLLGLREISLVMTPPGDRLAVRTFVTRPSDTVLRDGIEKELARGGQVFYVVPRIVGIEEHATRLRKLVPHARIRVAHGQMPGEMLEAAMVSLVEHHIDVLVSTTIIESGLDIPRANTMFVAEADYFGLAQLYQLRGRVGRSRNRAFCYLLVESLEKIQADARRRLEAIARYSELGSGFSVASHDLEIRGAGEILGARQSGQIQAIGFEAYSRILGEAVAELRGQPILRESDPELVLDVPAFLPEAYVEDTGTRLDFYRRLSVARDRDTVAAIMDELRDRFGEPPPEARCLEHVMAGKTIGRRVHALAIELRGERLGVRLGPDTPLSGAWAAQLASRTAGRMRLAGPDRITVKIDGRGDEARLRTMVDALAEIAAALPR